MDLSDALGDWPAGGNQPKSGGGAAWPGQPSAPGPWPGSGPTPNSGSGVWPGPTPSTGPGGFPASSGSGGWPSPAPSGPGGWPSPAPSGHGGWSPSGPPGPGGFPSGPTPSSGPAGFPSGPTPSAPGGWPSPAPSGPGGFPSAPQQNLTIPYNRSLPNGLVDKLLITIRGTVKPHADKFTIDLCAGRDIAFHFNPRFNEGGRKVVVRNSCFGNKWGKEERDLPRFPFTQGRNFEIKIMVTRSELKVAVDGSHLLEYRHRHTNLRAVNNMNIYYDVTLSYVNVEMLP